MNENMKHNKIHMKHKEDTFDKLTPQESHEPELQSFINSLSKCTVSDWVSLPQFPRNSKPLKIVLHTINRLCHWEIERPTVGEFFK